MSRQAITQPTEAVCDLYYQTTPLIVNTKGLLISQTPSNCGRFVSSSPDLIDHDTLQRSSTYMPGMNNATFTGILQMQAFTHCSKRHLTLYMGVRVRSRVYQAYLMDSWGPRRTFFRVVEHQTYSAQGRVPQRWPLCPLLLGDSSSALFAPSSEEAGIRCQPLYSLPLPWEASSLKVSQVSTLIATISTLDVFRIVQNSETAHMDEDGSFSLNGCFTCFGPSSIHLIGASCAYTTRSSKMCVSKACRCSELFSYFTCLALNDVHS